MTSQLAPPPPATSPWPRILLGGATAAWLAVFGYLLLTSRLPRLPLVDNGDLSAAGHAIGGYLLAVQLAMLLPDRPPAQAVAAGLIAALALVGAAEVVQGLLPSRAFELRDAAADGAGALAGAATAAALATRGRVTRQRARLALALLTLGIAAFGALVISVAAVVDRI